MYMKELPCEDKVDLFSPHCSKCQSEYACNNTQCTTLSASWRSKMHTRFLIVSFVVFQMCTEVTMYFVHEVELSSLIYALSRVSVPRRKYRISVVFDEQHCCAVKHALAFTLVCLDIFLFLFTCC